MVHMTLARSVVIGAIAVIVAGCGAGHFASSESGGAKEHSSTPRMHVIGPDSRIHELVGLPEAEAEARAKSWGFRVRVLRPHQLKSLSLERVGDRLNVVVKDGKVTQTWQG